MWHRIGAVIGTLALALSQIAELVPALRIAAAVAGGLALLVTNGHRIFSAPPPPPGDDP